MPVGSTFSRRSRLVVAVGVVAVGVVAAALPGAPARAQETDPAEPGAVEPGQPGPLFFGLDELGVGGSFPLDGVDGRAQVTVPVPAGTVPSTLDSTVTVPAWLDRGWVDVRSGDTPLTRIPLMGDAPTMPVSIPLAAAEVAGGAVTLEMSSTLIPDAGYCPDVRADELRFLDATVAYTGSPAIPRTIAEFLPPVLRRLTMFIPDEPGSDVIGAAATLTTSVIEFYGAQPVDVVVRPASELQGANSDGPFERSVVLSENSDAGAELIFPLDAAPPRLFVTGSGTDLLDQTRLITSSMAALALGTRATAGSSAESAVLAPDEATFDELGIGTVTGSPTASIALDQTRLGRSAAGVSVHLIGSYTPGSGTVSASVGDSTVAVWPADDTGILDQWVEIPNAELARVTTVDVTAETAGEDPGACGASLPTVTVDGASVVESSPSSNPVPLGFGSLPQAFMPTVGVALSENSYADAVRAVSILEGMQRLSPRTLLPQMVTMDQALTGTDPAVVVAPAGDVPETVPLPLTSSGATTFTATATDGSGATLSLDTALPYGTLQVTSNENGAALLVASSNAAPGELDKILGWLGADPSRWFELSGDVLLATEGIDPMELSSDDLAGPEADVAAESDESGSGPIHIAVVIGVLVLIVGIIAAVVIWLRSRRPGDGPAPR